MEVLAAQLGSDVPFFLHRGMARCQGRGEIITPLRNEHAGTPLIVVSPPESLSTAKVFGNFLLPSESERKTWSGSLTQSTIFNRLQPVASKMSEWIDRIAQQFDLPGCIAHQMSGSGSSYFGIFADHKSARIAALKLAARLPNVKVFCVQTTSRNSKALAATHSPQHIGTSG